MKYEIVEKDYSAFLYIPIEDDDEGGVPFSEKELETLWRHKSDSIVGMLLVMCYSGFRIAAYADMETNTFRKEMAKTLKTLGGFLSFNSC